MKGIGLWDAAGAVATLGLLAPALRGDSLDLRNPWYQALWRRFPDLFACATPPEIRSKAVAVVPTEFSELLGHFANPAIRDGCSVGIHADAARSAVYLTVSGGIDGDLELGFGPFPPDPGAL